jgi:hypothetical protein
MVGPMKTHHLKTWPEYFRAVRDGSKTFEARRDDRGFEVGDMLVLEEYDPDGVLADGYSGQTETRVVTYILRGSEHMAQGYCILALGRTP